MQKTGAISKNLASHGPDHPDQAQLVELDGYGVTAGSEQSAITYAGSRRTSKVMPPSAQSAQRFVGGDSVDAVMK